MRRSFAPKDLPRKYASELHANEIVLLAYYIASVNIESVYHDLISHGDTEARRPSDPNSVSPCLRVSNDTFALTKMRFAKKDYPVDENHNGKLDRWELEDRGRIIKVVTVSMETNKIVSKLPRLTFDVAAK